MKYEILGTIIAITLIIVSAIISYNVIEDKRLVALNQSIESASARGIDPIAVRCAYAKADDTICIVYTGKK